MLMISPRRSRGASCLRPLWLALTVGTKDWGEVLVGGRQQPAAAGGADLLGRSTGNGVAGHSWRTRQQSCPPTLRRPGRRPEGCDLPASVPPGNNGGPDPTCSTSA